MGYYSDFEIRVDGVTDDTVLSEMSEVLGEITGKYYEFVTYGGVIHSGERYKWYDHEANFAELSRRYPDHLFEMRVIGEDSEMWQLYAKGGKVYTNSIEPHWPPFDESRLPA